MSDKARGFVGRSIESVQVELFLRDLPENGGRFRYQRTGLNADPGTIVLFQYRARIIACAVFLRDEPFEKPRGGYGGELRFDPKSVRTFEPLEAEAMRKVWPWFTRFGHVKQRLNPAVYALFKRRLRRVKSPEVM